MLGHINLIRNMTHDCFLVLEVSTNKHRRPLIIDSQQLSIKIKIGNFIYCNNLSLFSNYISNDYATC